MICLLCGRLARAILRCPAVSLFPSPGPGDGDARCLFGQQAARDRDAPTAMAVATLGSVNVMLTAGSFDLAQAVWTP